MKNNQGYNLVLVIQSKASDNREYMMVEVFLIVSLQTWTVAVNYEVI